MSQASVAADPSQPGGGHALIRVPGAGASALADPRFRLMRDGYEAGTLGPGGWQVAEALLSPLSAKAEGDDLLLSVGPAVVDQVESGVVTLAVPAARFEDAVFWPDLPLSRSGHGRAGVALPGVPAAASSPKPTPEAPAPRPVAPPEPERQPSKEAVITPIVQPIQPPTIEPAPKKPAGPAVWVGLGAVVLAAAGGAAWWAMHKPAPAPQPAAAVQPPPVPVQPPRPAARDCSQGSIADTVSCAGEPDAIFAVAVRRWDTGQADQGLTLMQIAADRGSGAAALKLAQLYDPNSFHPGGPIGQPNARQAALYYRRAAQANQDGAAAPRAALRDRLQRDADQGDALAALTLKDFWP